MKIKDEINLHIWRNVVIFLTSNPLVKNINLMKTEAL